MNTTRSTRTMTIRHIQCVKCGAWLEDWEVHPECESWMLCFACGELLFHGTDILRPTKEQEVYLNEEEVK